MVFKHGSEDDSEWGRGRYEELTREICLGAFIGERTGGFYRIRFGNLQR